MIGVILYFGALLGCSIYTVWLLHKVFKVVVRIQKGKTINISVDVSYKVEFLVILFLNICATLLHATFMLIALLMWGGFIE